MSLEEKIIHMVSSTKDKAIKRILVDLLQQCHLEYSSDNRKLKIAEKICDWIDREAKD